MKRKYYADTEFGRVEVLGKNLKTLILYTFDGEWTGKYKSVSTKENNRSNFPYLRKLFSHRDTKYGYAYNANGVHLYDLCVDNSILTLNIR
jgi:hypothetical protein